MTSSSTSTILCPTSAPECNRNDNNIAPAVNSPVASQQNYNKRSWDELSTASDSDDSDIGVSSPATRLTSLRPAKPLKQTTLGFSKVSHDEYLKLERQHILKFQEEDKILTEMESKAKEEEMLHKRQKAAEKQRRKRARKRARLALEKEHKVSEHIWRSVCSFLT